MTEAQAAADAYHNLKAALEPLRIAVATSYGITALAECYCDVTGRYARAGVKPLRMEYLQSHPRLSALAWLLLHSFMIAGTLTFFWAWWQPAIFMLGFAVFLGGRAYRGLAFRPKPDGSES